MQRTIFLFCLFLFSFQLSAQETLYPPNPNITDHSLSKFLTELTLAVGKKDKNFILEHIYPSILNSFGGDGGVEEFKEYWNFDRDFSNFWTVMENILLIGGPTFDAEKEPDYYYLPYTFTDWPEQYDAFEHYVVFGTNVNVRDQPSVSDSKVLGQLSYQIVKIAHLNSEDKSEWTKISTIDGQLTGYAYNKFLVSPIGYRLGLYKSENGWMINMLVAGD
ncbi:SH3 domain-containing protein [Flagellimonas zhangzhouensis]|uniref:SH3 domain-containing protein n=1 Tax=Flagellimonas zhangzhouensis TaxID=1073328 RepID=A0A1H2X9P7_9FLAO|nr:SH3 domain-containing protein [Allomuricauda zhangzhouensis]SDQ29692.1 SH3 domain-containing protein [Allomuricauda zhangzhouensis]SDW89478.1 SH3 domain-containing protein [Allomuricauda zhangzhouensis]